MHTKKTLIEHHRGDTPTTLFEFVMQLGELYGERTAFSFFEKGVMSSFSYADFAQECTSTKQRLVGIIGKGDNSNEDCFTEDGLFKTGDLGRYNSDGNLMIVGRKNFLIITDEGENVSPEELEGEILLIPNVKECLVYGEGGVICCDIYCDKVDFEQCREGVRQQNRNLPPYKQIKNIRYRSCEFSKNSVGKIVRGGDNVQ